MKRFTIFEEYYDLITLLNEKEQGELLLAITKYMFENIEPDLNDKQMKIFKNLKRPLDKSKEQSKRRTKKEPNQNQKETKKKPEDKPNENTSMMSMSMSNVNVYVYIENNLGITISGSNYEKIQKWLEIFPEDVIKYAVDICVANNKKSLSYVFGILNNWKANNFKTLEEIKLKEKPKNDIDLPSWWDKEIETDSEENEELKEVIKKYE